MDNTDGLKKRVSKMTLNLSKIEGRRLYDIGYQLSKSISIGWNETNRKGLNKIMEVYSDGTSDHHKSGNGLEVVIDLSDLQLVRLEYIASSLSFALKIKPCQTNQKALENIKKEFEFKIQNK